MEFQNTRLHSDTIDMFQKFLTSKLDCPLCYLVGRHDPLNLASQRVSTNLFHDDQVDPTSAPVAVAQRALYILQVVSARERNSPSTAARNLLSPTRFLVDRLEDS